MGKIFRDIEQVRQDMKNFMPLHTVIELIDGKQLERVNDELYKKCCDLDEHPTDEDGTKDSTPSFTVAPHKELFYCFGCGASGDRFEYVSKKMNLEHIESIYKLADIMGFDLSPYYAEQTPEEIMRDALFTENSRARNMAHEALLADEHALNYLLGRGISMESIDEFMLGYAPQIISDQVTFFDGIPNSIALQLNRKDQFNDAILFPVCDAGGRMRYFQSRPFKPMPGMKYIGGHDTHPLYDETDRIFGFNVARKKLRRTNGRLVGVEGAPDTIVCNQHGIPAVGALGTAVNQNTFTILDKYGIPEFVLLLDGDSAGYDKSMKISEKYLTFQTKVKLRIATLPEGYDPDEFLNAFGAGELNKIIDNAPYSIQYLLDSKFNEMQPSTPTRKMEYLASVGKYIQSITDVFTRAILVDHIAKQLGLDAVQIDDHFKAQSATQSGTTMFAPDEEEILLGEAMRNPEFITELMTRFGPNDFYLTKHKILYDILKTAKYTDTESLFQIAKNLGVDTQVTYEWLNSIACRYGNVEFCLQDVEDKLIRRKSRERLARLDQELTDMTKPPQISIDRAMGDIYSISTKTADNMVFDSNSAVSSTMALIHDRMKNPGDIIGYSLGPNFRKLSKALLGIQTKTLTVVSANQSVGKTQLCENWAMHMAVTDGIPTLWISLEMDKDRMTFRHLSMLSGLPLAPLQTGNITMQDKLDKLDPWAAKLANAPFYIAERGHDIVEALAIAKRYAVVHHVKVIYVDYIQLQYVSSATNQQRHRELGIISKAWKQFSKEMDVAVIGISQLSKEALKEDIAKAEHGAGSYEIAQDADNYITLKEKSEEEIQERGIAKGNITMNVDKNRMGEGDILIDIYSDRPVQRMSEVYDSIA